LTFLFLILVNYLLDVDECTEESDDCLKGRSTCSNDPEGSYTCLCPKGYEGDGKINGSGCVIRSNRKIIIAFSKYTFVFKTFYSALQNKLNRGYYYNIIFLKEISLV